MTAKGMREFVFAYPKAEAETFLDHVLALMRAWGTNDMREVIPRAVREVAERVDGPSPIGEAAFRAVLDAMVEAGEALWVTPGPAPPDPDAIRRMRERVARYGRDVRTWATGDRDPAVRERLVRRSARLERNMAELWGP